MTADGTRYVEGADPNQLVPTDFSVPRRLVLTPEQRDAENRFYQKQGVKIAGQIGVGLALGRLGVPWPMRVASGYPVGAGADVAVDMAHNVQPRWDTANNLGLESLVETGTGELFNAGLMGAARFNMGRALRPTPKMARENPDLIDDALKARLRVRNPGEPPVEGQREVARAWRVLGRELSRASRRSPNVSGNELLGSLQKLRNEIAAGDPTDQSLAALDDFIAKFQNKWGSGAPTYDPSAPKDVQRLKIRSDRKAKMAHRAVSSGGSEMDVTDINARANKAVADDARAALESRNPRVRGANDAYRRARSMREAQVRAPSLQPGITETLASLGGGGLGGALGAGGGPGKMASGVGTYALTRWLNTPQMLSRQALLYSDPRFLMLARALPGFGGAAVADLTRRRE